MKALRIHILNVGHGDSILLAFPTGEWAVVDCHVPTWADRPPAIPLLQEAGVKTLAFVALTHPDRDHYSGLHQVLTTFNVECFIDSGPGTIDKWLSYWQEGLPSPSFFEREIRPLMRIYGHVRERHIPYKALWRRRGPLRWEVGEVQIEALAPTDDDLLDYEDQFISSYERGYETSRALNKNRISGVLLLTYGLNQLLLGGDAESITLRRIERQQQGRDWRITAVKIPHHGSDSSVGSRGWPWIVWTESGAHAVISNGGNTPHPQKAALEAIVVDAGLSTYCTSVGQIFADATARERFGLDSTTWTTLQREGLLLESRPLVSPQTYRGLAQQGWQQDCYLPLHGSCTIMVRKDGTTTVETEFDVPPLRSLP